MTDDTLTTDTRTNTPDGVVNKFKSGRALPAILGLGYAGLPLAIAFAEAGLTTLGLDIDSQKIEDIDRGGSYISHIPSERIRRLVDQGTLRASTDFGMLARCDAAVICVPTPLAEGKTPDLQYVIATAKAIASHLHPGQLVVLESTTYPGTTEEILLPILQATGLQVGKDFFLAYSPEREDPGNREFTTRTIPKIVGGISDACLRVASAVYECIVEQVVPASSTRAAEAVKLLENIYRSVNIAMVNELKLLFERMDIDIWEIIASASTKPFGFSPFYPGPGLGGHCIPIDPFYLSWKAKQFDMPTRFIELAGEINTAMPAHVVERVNDALNFAGKPLNGAQILLIGASYKRDVNDTRESPTLAIIRLLEAKQAVVRFHDPYVAVLRSRHLSREMSSSALEKDVLAASDAVIIITDHRCIDYQFIVDNTRLVVDTRNITRSCRSSRATIVTA